MGASTLMYAEVQHGTWRTIPITTGRSVPDTLQMALEFVQVMPPFSNI